MGRVVYEALFENDPGRTGGDALVAAWLAGAHPSGSHGAGPDEMDEGLYAVEDEEDLGMMAAADDRPEQTVVFSGGDYRVDVRVGEEGVLATQVTVRPGRASRSTASGLCSAPIRRWRCPSTASQSSCSWSTTRAASGCSPDSREGDLADLGADLDLERVVHLGVSQLAGEGRGCAQDGDLLALDVQDRCIAASQECSGLRWALIELQGQDRANHDLIARVEAHRIQLLEAALQRQAPLAEGVGEVALGRDGRAFAAIAGSVLAVHSRTRARSIFAGLVGEEAVAQQLPPGGDNGLFADAQGCTAAG